MTTYTTDARHPELRRCLHRRILGGVAAGVADHLDIDLATVRIAFAAATLLAGIGLPLYLAAWLLLPEEGAERSIGEELADRLGGR